MIAECIYSVNKRAKNYRDKIRKYKDDRYNRYTARNIENAEDEMEKYYTMKEELLTVFEPSLIHRQYVGEEKKRVFSNYCKKKVMISFGKVVTVMRIL